MLLGLHGSVGKGYVSALEEASALDCKVLQIFPYRRHYSLTIEEANQFCKQTTALGISAIFIHSRFLPSLASRDLKRYERSIELLIRELNYSKMLGANGYVMHVSAYSPDSTPSKGLERFVWALEQAYRAAKPTFPILVENVPGGGRRLGGILEELGDLLRLLDGRVPVEICLDTAHAWAYGYPINTLQGLGDFLETVDKRIGLSRIQLFHLNDTRTSLGSHRDDHWHIGEGLLGIEVFKHLAGHEKFRDICAVVETPKSPEWDRKNLKRLKELSG